MVFVLLELRLIKKQHKAWCEKYYEEAWQVFVGWVIFYCVKKSEQLKWK